MKNLRKTEPLLMATLLLSVVASSCSAFRHTHDTSGPASGMPFTRIEHIIHMGQSLGAGEQSLPTVTPQPTGFGNYKFGIGTHTWSANIHPDSPASRNAENFSFIPLAAQQRGAEGETIANGMCDHLSQTLKATGKTAPAFLFSYAGQGGRYIRELDKRHDDAKDPRALTRRSGGGYYKTSIDDVRRAKKTADALHLSYAVFAITWMQGEANGTLRLSRWDSTRSRREAIDTYEKDLINIKDDYQHDIRSITGQQNKIPFFTYQTAGTVAGTAQLMACDDQVDMYMVGPTYMLPNAENGHYLKGNTLVHGDGIHLTADGQRWLGEIFGKVMRKVIIEKQGWQPLRPLQAWRGKDQKSVFIRFHVPAAPLVVDTVFLPRQGKGLGFTICDKDGKSYEIKNVETAGNNIVKIILKDSIGERTELLAAYGLASYVADVSRPIQSINAKSFGKDGHHSIEISFPGDIRKEFAVLANEGVFYLSNVVDDNSLFTNLIIRETYLDNQGNTILKGEAEELRNKVGFQEGQHCFISRRFAFGNIHDSDEEQSTFYFTDNSYGTRAGQRYPLFNWCVSFQDMRVAAKQ